MIDGWMWNVGMDGWIDGWKEEGCAVDGIYMLCCKVALNLISDT